MHGYVQARRVARIMPLHITFHAATFCNVVPIRLLSMLICTFGGHDCDMRYPTLLDCRLRCAVYSLACLIVAAFSTCRLRAAVFVYANVHARTAAVSTRAPQVRLQATALTMILLSACLLQVGCFQNDLWCSATETGSACLGDQHGV